MQVTLHQFERCITDYDTAVMFCRENYDAMKMLKTHMERIRQYHPKLYREYVALMQRGEMELETLRCIGVIKHRFNFMGVCDFAAGIGASPWLFDVFMFSRKLSLIRIPDNGGTVGH